jgi:uncharacterized protein with ATP-grasp and redox domains
MSVCINCGGEPRWKEVETGALHCASCVIDSGAMRVHKAVDAKPSREEQLKRAEEIVADVSRRLREAAPGEVFSVVSQAVKTLREVLKGLESAA